MQQPLHVRYYDMLRHEEREVVLVLARVVAQDDLPVEELLAAWGRCPCQKDWDRLLIEVSDVLPEYRATEPFDDRDHVMVGQQFRVRLPEREEVGA